MSRVEFRVVGAHTLIITFLFFLVSFLLLLLKEVKYDSRVYIEYHNIVYHRLFIS
jgi:hypothetical protein